MIKVCKTCGVEFGKKYRISKTNWDNVKYCSVFCASKSLVGKARPFVTENTRKKMSASHLGSRRNEITKQRISASHLGALNPAWKGGITPTYRTLRTSVKYRKWRTDVFTRDNFTCQKCGLRGGVLNADHIKSFSFYPELRYEIDNGRTLCVDCHKKTDTYGGKSRKTYAFMCVS